MAARKSVAQPEVEEKVEEAPEPVLKISTLAPVRPTIEVDDKLYELKMMRDFGIAKQQQLNRDGREFGTLWNSEKRLTDSQQKRLKLLLERLFKTVLIVPEGDDVVERFDDASKADVVLHFTLAPARKAMLEMLAMQAQQETQTTDEEEADE